jgi:hypothetical protein
MITIRERTADLGTVLERLKDTAQYETRVAIPGKVVSFDAAKGTVSVQPTIKERVKVDGKETWQVLPILPDVPIVTPRAGGFLLSLPVSPGDEVLVVFADMCIDGWWQSGGTEQQIDRRRHDLSDGFAILGPWSQPRKVPGYSVNSIQIRNDAGDTVIELKDGKVKITAGTSVEINCPEIALSAEWGELRRLVDRRILDHFNNHGHSVPWYGGGYVRSSTPRLGNAAINHGDPLTPHGLLQDDDCTTENVRGK